MSTRIVNENYSDIWRGNGTFQNKCFTTDVKKEDIRDDQGKDGQTYFEDGTGISA